ncbi:MAG: acetyl-CoA acetyltransferase [Chloroflexota bacterium]|nr:MAG: acetyl-CoA acetyltransferase [Chloroflexota bacterium]
MNDRVAIIGIGWSGFRPITPEYSYKELMYEAAQRAYNDAGLDPRRDIESFITVAEDFHEGTSIFDEYTPDQLGAVLKPMHTISGDGLHGLATAYMLIKTGQFSTIALEGHSKASNMLSHAGITAYAQDPILNRPLRLNTHFIAGMEMNRYLHDTNTTHEQCAQVVVKNRRNALDNPSAPYGANLSVEDVLAGPSLSYPLGKRETAQYSDGAVVMVLANEETALALSDSPIWVLGAGWSNDSPSLENRDWSSAFYTQDAAQFAYRQAGIRNPLEAIDFAEVDDQYAYKELQSLEALGFFSPGGAGPAVTNGFTDRDGPLPVNISGGCLGTGNLLDANGLAKTLEVVLQLRGEAGPRQLDEVYIGLAQSWRGVPTASGAVAILAN